MPLAALLRFMGGFNFAPIFTQRLPVFHKQRAQKFHGVWTWVISNALVRVPESALTASMFSIIVYFSVSFTMSAARFWTYWLLLLGMNLIGVALFMFMGALTGSDVLAQGLGAVTGLMMISTSGFPIARSSIGGWLIWLYWANPMSWALRSLAINEMTSPDWNASAAPTGPADQALGAYVLESRGIFTEWKWVWSGVAYEFGFALLLVVLQGLALTYIGPRVATTPPVVEEGSDEASRKGGHAINVAPASAARRHAIAAKAAVPAVDSESPATTPRGTVIPKSTLPFEPLTLAFHGVSYWVPKPNGHGEELQLLQESYGTFRPGVLTALMGASGAGKTTLMDVLAGRKTAGRAAGVQTVNGHPKEMSTFARVMGYVEQLDVHVEQATVLEALLFSARLRLDPGLAPETVNAFVDEVMELVELEPLAHRVVLDLSTEQRKRLTIAVELVANPSVLFADEPTSGLDSRAALLVMKALRNIVNTGRTVVCTIHQPSTEIFTAFDELLLLKPGGKVIFNGPLGTDGAHLIDYFSSFPGVERPASTANPAVFMLEVSEPGLEKTQGIDWAQRWSQSELSKRALQEATELCQPKQGTSPISFKHAHAASPMRQWKLLLQRNMTTHWRNPSYNFLRFAITIVLGVFMGLLYLNRGSKTSTILGITDILGALYSTTMFLGIANLLIVLPNVAAERPAMYRERSSGLYSGLAYSTAQGMAESIYLIVQGLLYTVIVYFMVGFASSASKFWWFYIFFQLCMFVFTFFGMAAMHLAPSVPLATNGGSFFILLWNVFCGFLISKPNIGGWWIWAYWFNPTTYVLYGTITTQLGDVNTMIQVGENQFMPVSQYVADTYGYKYEWRGWLVLVLVGFVITCRLVATLGVTRLNFQKR